MHWLCMVCARPLEGRGTIQVHNSNPDLGPVGCYPLEPSPDQSPWANDPQHLFTQDIDITTPAEMAHGQVRDAIWLGRRPKNVDFGCYHSGCNPFKDLSPYQIPGSVDAEGWMGWVLHLSAKTWMGKWDLERMLAFYWTHKGAQPPLG